MIAKGRVKRTKITATTKGLLLTTEVAVTRRKFLMVRIRQTILRTKKEQPILATKTLIPDPNTVAGLGVRKVGADQTEASITIATVAIPAG